jgi:hypothetical protein
VELRGSADEIIVDLSGASSLGAYGMTVRTAAINLSGASRAMLDATEAITGEASGASRLFYRREPARLEVDASHGSRVDWRDEDVEEQW